MLIYAHLDWTGQNFSNQELDGLVQATRMLAPTASTPTIDFERLIELVRPHPYLYDRCEPEFKDVALKNQRWQLIGAEFGITGKF
ncbi:hypothetical protein HPB50_022638 [Hyalomma asiaticum]|uniref:Uncharacterized protein n=1 Tax=Hyalomma asiaticum TaxID=266040 RepID=A0ACB7RZH8_HYAAI|nr:hypothetical protein HPB50_022638 [Hyalomma asiaticum]